jgi:hypothetical protein
MRVYIHTYIHEYKYICMHTYIHRNVHLIIVHITSSTNTRVAGLSYPSHNVSQNKLYIADHTGHITAPTVRW